MPGALDWLMRQLGGDPEAEGAVASSSTMQPAVLDHLRNVLGDMPGRFGGGASYDPNRSLAQNTLDPESLQQATTIGMQVGPAAIRAYHGSPHDFERFDLSKIGTGEGAQAYGHGLYFAEREPVARSYRDALATDPRNLISDYIAGLQNFAAPHEITEEAIKAGLSRHDILAMRQASESPDVIRNIVTAARGRNDDGTVTNEALTAYRRLDSMLPKPSGKMYEVNLHADPATLLDRDKPLSEQPHVKAALDALNVTAGPRWELLPKTAMATAPDRLTPQAASAALREAGIPGVKYLDQGSRLAGVGSSNYVMFDDKLIEILRKYGLAGLTAGTGAAALGGNAEAAPADALDRIRRQLGEGAF